MSILCIMDRVSDIVKNTKLPVIETYPSEPHSYYRNKDLASPRIMIRSYSCLECATYVVSPDSLNKN